MREHLTSACLESSKFIRASTVGDILIWEIVGRIWARGQYKDQNINIAESGFMSSPQISFISVALTEARTDSTLIEAFKLSKCSNNLATSSSIKGVPEYIRLETIISLNVLVIVLRLVKIKSSALLTLYKGWPASLRSALTAIRTRVTLIKATSKPTHLSIDFDQIVEVYKMLVLLLFRWLVNNTLAQRGKSIYCLAGLPDTCTRATSIRLSAI